MSPWGAELVPSNAIQFSCEMVPGENYFQRILSWKQQVGPIRYGSGLTVKKYG